MKTADFLKWASSAFVACMSISVGAATCRYVGGGSVSGWSESSNWEDGLVPQPGDDVVVQVSAGATSIEIDGVYSLSSLTVDGESPVSFSGDGAISLAGDFKAGVAATFGAGLSLSFSKSGGSVRAGQDPANAEADVVFDCPVELADSVATFYFRGKGDVVFNGTFTGTSARIGPATGSDWSVNGAVTFNGVVKVKEVVFRNHTSRSEFVFNAPGNEWSLTEVAYGCISFGARNACPAQARLSWNTWARETVAPNYCSYCFKGFDQGVDRLEGVAAGSYDGHFINPNIYWSENAKASVLTLRGSDSARTDAKLVGALSVIWAPTGDYVQDFVNRAHTMSGFLAVSNGTLKVSQGATFANAGAINIHGGALETDNAGEGAFAGVTNVFISSSGMLCLDDGTPDPFSPQKARLELESGAKVIIPVGVVCSFRSVKVDGVEIAAWSYTGSDGTHGAKCDWIEGGGILQVSEGAAAGAAEWIGGGSDEKTSTAENWSSGRMAAVGDSVDVLAAQGRMLLTDDMQVKSFGFSAAQRFFSVESDPEAVGARLVLGGGGMTFAGDAAQTNVFSCPMALMASAQTWTLGGAGNALRINGNVTGLTPSGSLTVQADGAACEIGGKLDYCGTFLFRDGTLDVSGSSLGSNVTVRVEGDEKTTAVRFGGGEYVSSVCVAKKSGSGWSDCDAVFAGGRTNVFTKEFSVDDTWHTLRLQLNRDSKSVFRGGLSQTGGQYMYFMFASAPSSVRVEDKPLVAGGQKGVVLMSWSRSNEIVFATTNNSAAGSLMMHGVTVRTACDWAFSTNTVMTPLAMKALDGAPGSVFDLQGFDQALGRLVGGDDQDAYGVITSAETAVLHVYQTGADGEVVFMPSFTGAVSLCKHGEDALALSGENTSTGMVQVAQGTLSFAGEGSWRNASAVVLTGGKLSVDCAARLPKETGYRLLGGLLDLADGVSLVTRSASVLDGNGETVELESGVYTAENLPACISGGGRLLVKGDGLVIKVR